MKFFIQILICLLICNPAYSDSFTYGGISVQQDYRFTTQQDRNNRIKTIKDYLESTKIFKNKHQDVKKQFETFKKDKKSRANIKHLKFGEELQSTDYIVKGNYYLMADKILANYSVIYNNEPNIEYIYDMFGNLYQVAILHDNTNTRPYYKAIYSHNGELQKVNYFATDGFEYIFLANGDLQGVIIDNKMYNRIGRPVKVWLL